MLISLIAALATTPSAPNASAPKGPEPVYDLAKTDLRKLKEARLAQFAAATLPAVFMAGAFARGQLPKENGVTKPSPQAFAANGLYAVGGVGMVTATIIFHRRTIKSRKLLVAQGLRVRRTPPVIVPTLAVLGVAVAGFGAEIKTPSDQAETQLLVAGLAMYTVSVGIGSLQLDLNRRARQNAGWLALSPLVVNRETQGLALVGRW